MPDFSAIGNGKFQLTGLLRRESLTRRRGGTNLNPTPGLAAKDRKELKNIIGKGILTFYCLPGDLSRNQFESIISCLCAPCVLLRLSKLLLLGSTLAEVEAVVRCWLAL
jgi:hypothetical protein